MRHGRNSIGYEIDETYLAQAEKKIKKSKTMFMSSELQIHEGH